MNIEELKAAIENRSLNESFIVFKISDNDFIAKQYCKEISKQRNREISYTELSTHESSMFSVDTNELKIICVEELSEIESKDNNKIIICSKISKEVSEYYDNVVAFPKLEKWQIRDYALSKLSKVNEKYIDWLLDICKYDIYRLDLEIQKLLAVNATDAEFRAFVENGIFNDLTDNTVFNLTNAIVKKDKLAFINAYSDINSFDISPMGFWTILLKAFRSIIDIQLNPYSTPESCKLKDNQFWAIKKNNVGIYSKEDLVKIYQVLINVDFKIKTGSLSTENLIDYLIIKIH